MIFVRIRMATKFKNEFEVVAYAEYFFSSVDGIYRAILKYLS